jgi:hypothetical protein
MTGVVKSFPRPGAADKPARDASTGELASTLQLAAEVVDEEDKDSDQDPGDIAADDAGASRLATRLNTKN